MPEITVMHIVLATVATLVGVLIGWLMRSKRSVQEKETLNLHWQDEIEAQRMERGRLQGQNKNLMEQVSQFQASQKDATNRAKELSGALKETFERRDELQREIKDVRNALQAAFGERDQLQADVSSVSAHDKSQSRALQEKDDKIFKLSRELDNWQDRLPPLINRFQKRNDEANELQAELVEARARILALESMFSSDETRVDPVDPESLPDMLDASNDPTEDNDDMLDASNDPAEDNDDMLAAEELLDDDEDLTEQPEAAVEEDFTEQAEEEEEEEEEATETNAEDDGNDVDAMNSRDDLKKIKGVGPAIEKTLNELGIFTIDQIAAMSEYDIDRVAKRLKGFRTRIYREDWIGQARSLQDQQSSEPA